MRVIADLHIHSGYSRATSPRMNIEEIVRWADKKGIGIIGSGDFQHPGYFGELKNRIIDADEGLCMLRKGSSKARIMLTTEISSIYKHKDKVRKIHTLVMLPGLKNAEIFSKKLAEKGNTASDGRPILGMPAKDVLKFTLDICPEAMVIPAHAWTPWFSVFGAKSGYDSLEECFEEETHNIRAIETGLSSDPAMNWMISGLDNISLISNSDAHSPEKIGREANVFDCGLSYYEVKDILYKKDLKRFLYTIEFFPEEGKYHNDGHRECGINMHPKDAEKTGGICPVCGKALTPGVLHRVKELADRPWNTRPKNAVPYKSIIQLEEIISDVKEAAPSSKKVKKEYEKMLSKGGTEFEILLDRTREELLKIGDSGTADAIIRMRKGNVKLVPGYDGEFGKISIFREIENAQKASANMQLDLFGK
ncbi:MAG: endonuclease Q family protein, partial [Candidatus Goldiibacteriota bacterium]